MRARTTLSVATSAALAAGLLLPAWAAVAARSLAPASAAVSARSLLPASAASSAVGAASAVSADAPASILGRSVATAVVLGPLAPAPGATRGDVLTTSSRPTSVRNLQYSINWSGYEGESNAGDDDGVAGSWKVPTVRAAAGHFTSSWVGIDGVRDKSLIQTGTEEDGPGHYHAWWEILPATAQTITLANGTAAPVRPGDVMLSSIETTSRRGIWRIYEKDVTRGWVFDALKTYDGHGTSVEWITEAPQVGGHYTKPADFGTMSFDDLLLDHRGRWYDTHLTSANAVDMADKKGQVLAAVSRVGTQKDHSQYFYDAYEG